MLAAEGHLTAIFNSFLSSLAVLALKSKFSEGALEWELKSFRSDFFSCFDIFPETNAVLVAVSLLLGRKLCAPVFVGVFGKINYTLFYWLNLLFWIWAIFISRVLLFAQSSKVEVIYSRSSMKDISLKLSELVSEGSVFPLIPTCTL